MRTPTCRAGELASSQVRSLRIAHAGPIVFSAARARCRLPRVCARMIMSFDSGLHVQRVRFERVLSHHPPLSLPAGVSSLL